MGRGRAGVKTHDQTVVPVGETTARALAKGARARAVRAQMEKCIVFLGGTGKTEIEGRFGVVG